MGTYTKSSVNRTARPRSERLRELGGLIVPVSAAAASGGYMPAGLDHTHPNLVDLNRITVVDGYIYLTDEVIDQTTGEAIVQTTKVSAGYADRAGANESGHTLDWFIPASGTGRRKLNLNSTAYTGIVAPFFEGSIVKTGAINGAGEELVIGNTNNDAYVYLVEDTIIRWIDIKCAQSAQAEEDGEWSWEISSNGNAQFGSVKLLSTGHLDIGPVRVLYDSTNKALRITKVSNSDTNSYGIYADGFVSSGAVQSNS